MEFEKKVTVLNTENPFYSDSSAAVDESVLKMLLGFDDNSNQTFLVELIEIYLAEAHHLIVEMKNSIASNKIETFTRAAHTLKSSSANLGALHLAALSKELEGLGKSHNLRRLAPKIAALELEFRRVNFALQKYLS